MVYLQAEKENEHSDIERWISVETPFGIAQVNNHGEIKLDKLAWDKVVLLQGRNNKVSYVTK